MHTPGMRVVNDLWPDIGSFPTAWGRKTREGLAACIDNITSVPALVAALRESQRWLGKLAADHDGDHIAQSAMRQYERNKAALVAAGVEVTL